MDKRKIRDYLRLAGALICVPIYMPHILAYLVIKDGRWGKLLINSDIRAMKTDSLKLNSSLCAFLYLLHNDRWFRRLFYYRLGPIAAMLISWIRPGDRSFIISYQTKIGPGVRIAHPYSTVLNAESIGANFSCMQCTTIGKKGDKRPTIGDNVSLGANLVIIGDVKIGNNVIIGAGSVVVKNIPDNSVAVGNPARVIKTL